MKIFKGIIKAIIGILLLISVLITTLSFALHTLTNTSKLANDLADDNLTSMVCEAVKEEIEVKTMLFQLGSDTFYKCVTNDEMAALTRSFMKNLVEHYVEGKNLNMPYFESEALKAQIEADLQLYASENGLEIEEGSVEEIYHIYCGIVSSKCAVVSQDYLEALPTFEKHTKHLGYGPIALVVSVILVILYILVDIKKVLSGLYGVFAWIWSAGALVFIPTFAFHLYDLPSRIAIGRSPLKELVRNILDAVLYRTIGSGFLVLLGATLALITVIAILVAKAPGSSRRSKRSSHSGKHRGSPHGDSSQSHQPEVKPVFGITEEDIEGPTEG